MMWCWRTTTLNIENFQKLLRFLIPAGDFFQSRKQYMLPKVKKSSSKQNVDGDFDGTNEAGGSEAT